MKRWFMPLMLSFMTLLLSVKIFFPAWYDQQVEQKTVALQHKAVEVAAVAAHEVAGNAEKLSAYWLPSAEAAADIKLLNEAHAASAPGQDRESVRKMREQLEARANELNEREKSLQEAEQRASERIAELEKLEARIQDILQQEQSINDKKIKRLTAVYEGMKAEKAAPVIAGMKLETVVKMFSRMDEKQVGKILSFMSPEKAVQISQALTKQIGTISQ